MNDEPAVADPPVPDKAEVVADSQPDDAIRLLKEYRDKITKLVASARAARGDRSALAAMFGGFSKVSGPHDREEVWREARTAFTKLRPPASDLARYTSGLVERSRLGHLTKLELRLLLAEFEAELENAAELFRRSPQ